MKCRLLMGIAVLFPVVAFAQGRVVLSANSEVETVYRWSADRCRDGSIPDSPARAYRRSDGSIILIAAHYTNEVLEGASFDSLKPNCAITSQGDEDPDPSKLNDRFWIQALMRAPHGGIVALTSNEYDGKRHAGKCANAERAGSNCWYSSILLAKADERELHFHLSSDATRIVATSPARYDPSKETRTGFFTTTNIVRTGGWAYFMAWMEEPGKRGNCLFRTQESTPLGPWLALKDGSFIQQYSSPYRSDTKDERCDVVGVGSLNGLMRSMVWIEKSKVWIGVFSVAGENSGVYYSLSDDLIAWSKPTLLFEGRPWYNARGCGPFYDYPSLIDHSSESPEFSSGGGNLYLYMTRFNWRVVEKVCHSNIDRDLVRVRITAQ